MEIINPEKKDTILLSEVDPPKHIVVGISFDCEPLLFTPTQVDAFTKMQALIISDSTGNAYSNTGNMNIHQLIVNQLRTPYHFKKLAAFPKEEWKDAFKWLIDNA